MFWPIFKNLNEFHLFFLSLLGVYCYRSFLKKYFPISGSNKYTTKFYFSYLGF